MIGDVAQQGVTRFQEIFVPVCGLLALRSLVRTWAGKTPRISGLLAVVIWSAATFAIAVPDLTSIIARKVGINRGADLVLYLAILAGLGVCFYFYQRTRQMENVITELVRREAIRGAEFGSRKSADEFGEPSNHA